MMPSSDNLLPYDSRVVVVSADQQSPSASNLNAESSMPTWNDSLSTLAGGLDRAPPDPLRASTTGVLLCLVIVFTLTGNSLVVVAVASTRRLRSSVTNYFVVSLAVADLTVAVLVMPYAVLYELYGRWTFGWAFCYFWISCDVTCCTASILHLCVIAVDRYLAVTEPLTYRTRMSKRRAIGAIAGVWACSSAISFVPIYAGWFVDRDLQPPPMKLYEDGPECGLYVNRVYAVVSSSTSFYLPLIVMVVLYAKIFRIARRQSAEIRKLEKSIVGQQLRSSPTGTAATAASGSRGNHRRTGRVTGDTKAVKTLGTLMGLFIVSWLPFFVVYLVKPFCQGRCTVPGDVDIAVTWLGYCNSFINPVVYAFLNRDFRSAFRRVILCGRLSQSSQQHPPSSCGYDLDVAAAGFRRRQQQTSVNATAASSSRRLTQNGSRGAVTVRRESIQVRRDLDGSVTVTTPMIAPASCVVGCDGAGVRLKMVQIQAASSDGNCSSTRVDDVGDALASLGDDFQMCDDVTV